MPEDQGNINMKENQQVLSESDIIHYQKQILQRCPRSLREKVSKNLSDSIESYLEENSSVTKEEFIEHFGTPEDFSFELFESLETDKKKKRLFKNHCIKIGIIAIVFTFIFLFAITSIIIIWRNNIDAGYYYETTIYDESISE